MIRKEVYCKLSMISIRQEMPMRRISTVGSSSGAGMNSLGSSSFTFITVPGSEY